MKQSTRRLSPLLQSRALLRLSDRLHRTHLQQCQAGEHGNTHTLPSTSLMISASSPSASAADTSSTLAFNPSSFSCMVRTLPGPWLARVLCACEWASCCRILSCEITWATSFRPASLVLDVWKPSSKSAAGGGDTLQAAAAAASCLFQCLQGQASGRCIQRSPFMRRWAEKTGEQSWPSLACTCLQGLGKVKHCALR